MFERDRRHERGTEPNRSKVALGLGTPFVPVSLVADFLQMMQTGIEIALGAVAANGATIGIQPSCIAVFGGRLTPAAELSSTPTPLSLRDAFVRWLQEGRPDLSKKLLLPESFEDWNNFDTYPDLLAFEEDLGYVTSVVVIFLEAPGSIAELGSFSQIPSLRDQLVVVTFDSRHPKKSFISLGPLRQIENRDNQSVCVIPNRGASGFVKDVDVLMEAVSSKMASPRGGRRFEPCDKKHQILLALDVITLLEVATISDIRKWFIHFLVDVLDGRVRQILFTLEKANLIQVKRYGGYVFYLPVQRGMAWLEHTGALPERPFNRARVVARIATVRDPKSAISKAFDLVYGGGEQ